MSDVTRRVTRHLRAVEPVARGGDPAAAASGYEDVGLLLMIFTVAALPLASELAGVGRWSEASLGVGTLGVLLVGRELWRTLVERYRARRSP